MCNIRQCIKQVDRSLCSLVPYAILAQGEANAILEQEGLFFQQNRFGSDYITRINTALSKTKGLAKILLDECLTNFSHSITSFQNYLTMYSSVITAVRKDASEEQWINNLQLLRATAKSYEKDITQISSKLTDLIAQTYKVTDACDSAMRAFNLSINGDNNELAELNDKLHHINTNIDGTFAAVLIGNLLIVGGTLIIILGSVFSKEEWVPPFLNNEGRIMQGQRWAYGHYETAYYTNWKLMTLGVVTDGVGLGGSIGGFIYLSKLFKEKSKLFFTKENIEVDVKLSLSINDGCKNLVRKMINFNENIEDMKKKWLTFTNYLKQIEDDLSNRKISTKMVDMFFESVIHSIEDAMKNVAIIKNKLSGITTIKDKKGEGMSAMILKNIRSTLA